jgi:hypothetical protein
MKAAIELLERAKADLVLLRHKGAWVMPCKIIRAAYQFIDEAMALLKAPRWYTPEQWEKRTGKAWPDSGAVYWRGMDYDGLRSEWRVSAYKSVRLCPAIYRRSECVCATEAGPPPENWEPEE